MARAPRLSNDSTSVDNTNSVAAEEQMPIRSPGRTIADVLCLDFEPTSKAQLARSLAHMYEYEQKRGAAPLPDFDVFLVVLAHPCCKWTPQASALFRRISRIIQDSRRSSPVRVTQRESMRGRRAARRRSSDRSIEREASEAATVSTTEGPVRCCDERSQVS